MRIEFQKNKTKGSLHLLHFLFSDIADTSQSTPWSISPGSCRAAAPATNVILPTGSSTPSAPSGPSSIYTAFLVLGLTGFYSSSLEMNPGLARLVTGPCGAGGRAQSLLAPPAPPLPRLAPGCIMSFTAMELSPPSVLQVGSKTHGNAQRQCQDRWAWGHWCHGHGRLMPPSPSCCSSAC